VPAHADGKGTCYAKDFHSLRRELRVLLSMPELAGESTGLFGVKVYSGAFA
jgi:hypothetical protein